jgi:hypothetical protein
MMNSKPAPKRNTPQDTRWINPRDLEDGLRKGHYMPIYERRFGQGTVWIYRNNQTGNYVAADSSVPRGQTLEDLQLDRVRRHFGGRSLNEKGEPVWIDVPIPASFRTITDPRRRTSSSSTTPIRPTTPEQRDEVLRWYRQELPVQPLIDAIPAGVPDAQIWHVYPVNDLREHVISGARGQCWCRPCFHCEPHGWVVVHNSLDGREAFEEGRRKPS